MSNLDLSHFDPKALGATADDMAAFFGDVSWDFKPNSTFVNFKQSGGVKGADAVKKDPNNTLLDGEYFRPCNEVSPNEGNVNYSSSSPNSMKRPNPWQNNKPNKMPNMYELLKQAQDFQSTQAPLMMSMSPLMGGYGDLSGVGMGMGMNNWASPNVIDTAGMAGIHYPNSPPILTAPDPSQQIFNMVMIQNRMKKARLSPIMGPEMMLPNLNMMVMQNQLNQRTIKLPLSPSVPASLTLRPPNSVSRGKVGKVMVEDDENPMPLLLPAGKLQTKNNKVIQTTETMEKNLRSFLHQTRELTWETATVQDLKKLLRSYELNATGKKADLMKRIKKIREQYCHLEEGYESKDDLKDELYQNKNANDNASPTTLSSETISTSDNNMGNTTQVRVSLDNQLDFSSLDDLFAGGLEMGPDAPSEILLK